MNVKSDYRKVLGTFATGVTIITTELAGEYYGFTANSFTSVSLDPSLVLFCVKNDATFIDALADAKVFGVNILSIKQESISNKFANPALLNEQRFDGLKTHRSELKCPILKGSLAYLDCELFKITKAGDHLIVLGKVKNFDKYEPGDPLLYFGGGYRGLKDS